MRKLLLASTLGLMAFTAPAFAQYAGEPGAVGVGGGLTGSNPPQNPGWNYGRSGYGDRYGYSGYGWGGPGVTYYDVPVYGPGLIEGRGAYEEDGYGPNRW